MALKDWEHVYGNTFTYQRIDKNRKYIVLHVKDISGTPYVTLGYPGSLFEERIWMKEFKSKSQALKFAKQYMRTH